MSLKALAERVLQGNSQGNQKETKSFLTEKTGKLFEGSKETSFPDGNRKETTPGAMIREMLDDLNRLNWEDVPPLSGNEVEESFRLGEEIDRLALAGDIEALQKALDRYMAFWLKLRDKPGQALLFG